MFRKSNSGMAAFGQVNSISEGCITANLELESITITEYKISNMYSVPIQNQNVNVQI